MDKKPELNNIPDKKISGQVQTPEDSNSISILTQFDLAERENQLKRHKSIGSLFDTAAEVIENYLNDPNTELASKMFPAKLAADIYLAQEKFKREDERIELEKRKIVLDELKSGKSVPVGSKFTQNNNYYYGNQPQPQPNTGSVDVADLKKRQEELLSKYLTKESD